MKYLMVIMAFVLVGCGVYDSSPQVEYVAGDRHCLITKVSGTISKDCSPGTWTTYQPVAASDKDDGTALSLFQDVLDLKIFQPTFIEGSGLTLFGGAGAGG